MEGEAKKKIREEKGERENEAWNELTNKNVY